MRPVGAKLFHAEGHRELNIRFSQFCESASNMEHNLDTYNRRFSGILKVFENNKNKAEGRHNCYSACILHFVPVISELFLI